MNNIENESTFFVSIERKKVSQNSNNKFQASKYFIKSIKVPKTNNSSTNLSKTKKNNNTNIQHSLFNAKKLLNNIPNLKTQNNSFKNKIQNKPNNENLLFPSKKKIDEDLDLNIEDTDEHNDSKFHININQSKFPLYNQSYFENITEQFSNPNANSQILKSKKYHSNFIKNKNKSCDFGDKNLIKWNLEQKISTLNKKIELLKNLLKRRHKDILEFQIFFEKNNTHRKIKKFVLQSDISGADLKKKSFKLKMEKLKCEEKYISKKKSEEEIKKEKLLFSQEKINLIEKILDYKILIMEKNAFNEFYTNNDEATIVNDSNIFDNYLNTMEDKIEIKKIEHKNISLNNVTDEEDSVNINFNNVKNFNNKKSIDYFKSNIIINRKIKNRNNPKELYDPNSKFNIRIDYNKIKK